MDRAAALGGLLYPVVHGPNDGPVVTSPPLGGHTFSWRGNGSIPAGGTPRDAVPGDRVSLAFEAVS